MRVGDWRIDGVALEAGDHAYSVRYGLNAGEQSFSQITLFIDVTRLRSPALVDDLGFIFAFMITGLSYFVPCTELGLRVGMTTGSLFAAVVDLNRLLDAAGYKPEFGLVERLGFLIFATMLVSLMISVFSKHRMAERGRQGAGEPGRQYPRRHHHDHIGRPGDLDPAPRDDCLKYC